MLSIVVPVFNGEKTIITLIEEIKSELGGFSDDWELIFVDDGSTDNSLDFIKKAADDDKRIGWLSLRRNAGQQLAVLCGIRHSRGEWVITMDDDLGHPARLIPALFLEIQKGWDVVYAVASGGSRAGGVMRDLFFRWFLKKPAGLRIGSYRIFNRHAVNHISAAAQSFVYISAELFRAGLRVSSIEYDGQQLSDSASVSTDDSRYTFRSRLKLYLKLIHFYGPLSSRREGTQYEIDGRGGFL